MSRLEKVLQGYRSGVFSPRWAELEFAVLLTPDNVDWVMPQLPQEIVAGLSRWNFDEPGLIVGSSMSEPERQRLIEHLNGALPVLRAWFAARGQSANGVEASNMVTSPTDPAR